MAQQESANSPASALHASLSFSNTPLPDPSSWEHVIVSLSERKQDQIMNGVGGSHSEESRFSTWSVIGETLSMALLSESGKLYVQSTMKLHRKDFLLFTRKNCAHGDGTAGIIEVDFVQKLENEKWQGHWQKARAAMVYYVKESLGRFLKSEQLGNEEGAGSPSTGETTGTKNV